MDGTELIKVGTVEVVRGTKARVRFKGKGTTSMDLTILDNTQNFTVEASGGSGYGEFASHSHRIKRWVPSIGDSVLCIMIPNGNGQGFVIGSVQD
jgi:hypothetical protein